MKCFSSLDGIEKETIVIMLRPTCQAICNNKKPCNNYAKKGSDFCGVHKHCVKIVKVENYDLERENEKLKQEKKELEDEVYTLLAEVVFEKIINRESLKEVLLKYLDECDIRDSSSYAIQWAFEESEYDSADDESEEDEDYKCYI